MEAENATPSTSRQFDVDVEERSFMDDNFKGEFTNALLYANQMYEEQNLLTKEPPEKITSVSIAMAKEIHKAIINVLNDGYVTTEEELILFEENGDEDFVEVCFIAFYFYSNFLFS